MVLQQQFVLLTAAVSSFAISSSSLRTLSLTALCSVFSFFSSVFIGQATFFFFLPSAAGNKQYCYKAALIISKFSTYC
jgi:hypothetical protein